MKHRLHIRNTSQFETLGIGFGPAAIAIAAALQEALDDGNVVGRTCFFERQDEIAWQPGLLLRNTDIQHHFLRDLSTPRNPRSPFTFVNYLKEHDRLFEFGELALGAAGGAVSRLEWSDYVRWAGNLLSPWARLGETVLDICPRGDTRGFEITATSGVFTARNVVLACGRAPRVPASLYGLSSRALAHSSDYLSAVARRASGGQAPQRIVVVGSGQSAIEVTCDLHERYPTAQIEVIHRGPGFQHVDLSQFSNGLFHPAAVDEFHGLSSQRRRELLGELRPLNYSVVDAQAADTLYRRLYEDNVVGHKRVTFHTFADIVAAGESRRSILLAIHNKHTARQTVIKADFVVSCTGFQIKGLPDCARGLIESVKFDSGDAPIVDRDYRVALDPTIDGRLFLAGLAEHTHGIGDGASFSSVAVRAERISAQLICDQVGAEGAVGRRGANSYA